MKIKK